MSTDVPPQVRHGRVTGYFTAFTSDTADPGNTPDETPLTGSVRLTPLTRITRWPTAVPPRMALLTTVIAPVINGELCNPDTLTPGVALVATDQPEGNPAVIQWRADFSLSGLSGQPPAKIFDVPDGDTVDLSQLSTP